MKVSKVMQLLSASGGDFARLLDYSATKLQVGLIVFVIVHKGMPFVFSHGLLCKTWIVPPLDRY